jgi:hypothetical protein
MPEYSRAVLEKEAESSKAFDSFLERFLAETSHPKLVLVQASEAIEANGETTKILSVSRK